MRKDELRDLNKERVGNYRDLETGKAISIEGPNLGLYQRVYEDGTIQPLGTVVMLDDVKGLVKIID